MGGLRIFRVGGKHLRGKGRRREGDELVYVHLF
jgi:hypothetical protein